MLFGDTEGFNVDRILVHKSAQDASVNKKLSVWSRGVLDCGLGAQK